MNAPLTLPAPDAPAEEWGRLAVSIPGWRWMPGMLNGYALKGGRVRGMVDDGEWVESFRDDGRGMWVEQAIDSWPDPDDPATAGFLLALLGNDCDNVAPGSAMDGRAGPREWWAWDGDEWWAWDGDEWGPGVSLGRACIAAAAALGRWPGGAV